MAWHNSQDNKWTIDLLNIDSNEQILEVGFGPGAAIESIVRTYPSAQVAGLDHSKAMLDAANYRNQAAVAAGYDEPNISPDGFRMQTYVDGF
ncbi:MAG: hypothetical protein HY080_05330 [Gammaproteobacteria bacterium]|nr:hypothetical protein [Gammaproteobacteria bacterium]